MKRTFDTVNLIKSRYERTSEFYFSLYCYKKPLDFKVPDPDYYLLNCLLNSDEFKEEFHYLFPIDEIELKNAIKLNRYEFEGSLIDMLLTGTCTDKIVADENEARILVDKMLSELKIDKDICVFKFYGWPWSLENGIATISYFYIVFQSLHRYWMIIGVADFY